MAKEQVHNWLRTVVVILTIGVAGGGYAMKINSNTNGIEKVDLKVEKVDVRVDETNKDLHRLELTQRDLENLASKTYDTTAAINAKLESIQKTQTAQSTIQAINSEKLKTLTK